MDQTPLNLVLKLGLKPWFKGVWSTREVSPSHDYTLIYTILVTLIAPSWLLPNSLGFAISPPHIKLIHEFVMKYLILVMIIRVIIPYSEIWLCVSLSALGCFQQNLNKVRNLINICYAHYTFPFKILSFFPVLSGKAADNGRLKKARTFSRLAIYNSILGITLTVIGLIIFLAIFSDKL